MGAFMVAMLCVTLSVDCTNGSTRLLLVESNVERVERGSDDVFLKECVFSIDVVSGVAKDVARELLTCSTAVVRCSDDETVDETSEDDCLLGKT